MIIQIRDNDSEKVLKFLEENGINYRKEKYLWKMSLRYDIEDMLDNEYEYDDDDKISTLSEKEKNELVEYVEDSFTDYDYSYYDDFIRECLYDWLSNERGKVK